MVPDATRLAHLAPFQRAEFSVTSRLFSCLVTEFLLRAVYFPLPDVSATGFALILLRDPSEASAFRTADIQIADVFALIPLQGIPILDCEDGSITLLDTLDMVPLPLVISQYDQSQCPGVSNAAALKAAIVDTLNACGWFKEDNFQLEVCWDPGLFWRNYARYANLTSDLTEQVAQELANCVRWQGMSTS
jgi:hypothetical protein